MSPNFVRMLVGGVLAGWAHIGMAAVSLAITNGDSRVLTQEFNFDQPEITVSLFGIQRDGSKSSSLHALRDTLVKRAAAKGNVVMMSPNETYVFDFDDDNLGTITKIIVDVNHQVQFAGIRAVAYDSVDQAGSAGNVLRALARATARNDVGAEQAPIAFAKSAGMRLSTFFKVPTTIKPGVTYEPESGLRISTPNDADTDSRSGVVYPRLEPSLVPRGEPTQKSVVFRGVVVADLLDSQVPTNITYSNAYNIAASSQLTNSTTNSLKTVVSAKGTAKLGDIGFEASAQVENQGMQMSGSQTTNSSSVTSTNTAMLSALAGSVQVLILKGQFTYTETPVESTLTGATYVKVDIQQSRGSFDTIGSYTFVPNQNVDAKWCDEVARYVIESQDAGESRALVDKMVARNILSSPNCKVKAPTNLRIGMQ
jgi:hypothetical protein